MKSRPSFKLLLAMSALVGFSLSLPIAAQTASKIAPTLQLYAQPTAPDLALSNANFGGAASASGNILVSGEMNSQYSNLPSRVRIFTESAGQWKLAHSFNVFPSINLWVNVVATNVSGNAAIVGLAPSQDLPYSAINGFRIYQFASGAWTETAHVDVTATDGISRADGFGSAVAIDGVWAAIGNAHAGTVSLYHASGSGTTWSLQKTLQMLPTDPVGFGRAVSLQGNELLVGMPGDASLEDPTNVGSVAIFTLTAGSWTRTSALTPDITDGGLQFGWTIARRGNLAAVGARGNYSNDHFIGRVFVFEEDTATGSWSSAGDLAANDAAMDDRMSQSISTDGVNVLAGTAANKAYLFSADGMGGWNQTRVDSPVADGFLDVEFGSSVAIPSDGSILIGAPQDSSAGVAFGGSIYQFSVTAPDIVAGSVSLGNTHDRDQFAASIDADGPLLAVGIPLSSGPYGYNLGAVTAYVTDITSANLLRQLTTLVPAEVRAGDGFGSSVAVSNDRIAALSTYGYQVGTGPSGSDGSAYIYTFNPSSNDLTLEQRIPHPAESDFGWGTSIALRGDYLAIGATSAPGPPSPPGYENDEPDSGVVYIFLRNTVSGVWALDQTLMVTDTVPIYSFGSALAWCGNRLVVGASFGDDYPSATGGAAYVFAFNAGTFTQQSKIVAAGNDNPPNFFGSSVACTREGTTVGVGSRYGEAFVFEEAPALSGNWMQKIRATIPQNDELFLTGMRFVHNTLYVAVSPSADTLTTEVGSVHTLKKTNGTWSIGQRFTSTYAQAGDWFGTNIGTLGYAVLAASPGKPVAPATNVGKVEAFGNVFEIFSDNFDD